MSACDRETNAILGMTNVEHPDEGQIRSRNEIGPLEISPENGRRTQSGTEEDPPVYAQRKVSAGAGDTSPN